MSLVTEAMAAAKIKPVTVEQMDLAIAWAEGKVTTGACAKVLKFDAPVVHSYMGRYLVAAVRAGRLKRTNNTANDLTPEGEGE